MVTGAAGACLAALLGAAASLDLGLSGELRRAGGGPPGASTRELVPYVVSPRIGLHLDLDPRLAIGLATDARLSLLAPSAGSLAVRDVARYHTASAFLSWRADERLSLTLGGSASGGTLQTSPLSQLTQSSAAPGSGAPPGQAPTPLDPSVGLRTASHAAAAGRASLSWRVGPTLTAAGSAGYALSEGRGDLGRIAFPRTENLVGESSLSWAPGALDTVGALATYSRTRFDPSASADLLGLSGRWEHLLQHDLRALASAGAVWSEERVAASARARSGLLPLLEAGVTKAAPAEGRGLGASLRLGYAPFVDVYAGGVRQRISGSATADWASTPRLRVSLAMAGATAVGRGQTGPGFGAMELALWSVRRELEVGIALRGGFQEGATGTTGRIWQWGLSLGTRWRTQGSL